MSLPVLPLGSGCGHLGLAGLPYFFRLSFEASLLAALAIQQQGPALGTWVCNGAYSLS